MTQNDGALSRIVSESLGPSTWRAGLADPHLHWKRGRSAWELAVSWEAQRETASGIPPEIAAVFASHPGFAGAELLIGAVEHRVVLDTPRGPSQNDLWGILWAPVGHVSMAVEGKAGEEFGPRLRDWLKNESEGKEQRLAFLCDVLGVSVPPDMALRYQLFHRAASAILEARRWKIGTALMLVQSFAEYRTSWSDYCAFASLLGLGHDRNSVSDGRPLGGITLHLSWVDSKKAQDSGAAEAI